MSRLRLFVVIPGLFLIHAAFAEDAIQPAAELPATTPWNLASLSSPPKFEWLDSKGPVRSLTYAGEPFQGRPTKVFAYYATPQTLAGETRDGDAQGAKKLPAVVLVHGGGGTAFREWVELWAKHGYAAIAMDLAGDRPLEEGGKRERLADGGPDQSDEVKFGAIDQPVTEHWPYHAVANVIRVHSLLRSFPAVDAARTGLTGISWGGYLTCIVASVDNRFRAAVPVYGCGFLHENSFWLEPRFHKMSPEHRDLWVARYDPSRYLPACRVPILFVNGTNDFAYPLDSYMKSYALVKGPRNIRVTVNMPHGHSQGWAPAEIAAFVDQHLRNSPPLPKVGPLQIADGRCSALVDAATRLSSGALHFTTESGPINKRAWTTVNAELAEKTIRTPALPTAATAWFVTVTDERNLTVSSEVSFVRATTK